MISPAAAVGDGPGSLVGIGGFMAPPHSTENTNEVISRPSDRKTAITRVGTRESSPYRALAGS